MTKRIRLPVLIAGGCLWTVAFVALGWMLMRPEPPERERMIVEQVQAGTVAQPQVIETARIPDGWQPPKVDGFTLVDQDGAEVTAESLAGKPYVAGFVFTRCGFECPDLMRQMVRLREQLGDFGGRFLTVTVDPEYDTPAQMAKYAEIFAADIDSDDWKFLSGEPEELLKLMQFGYRQLPSEPLTVEDNIGPKAAHSLRLMHVDAEGRLTGSYFFRDADDIRRLRRVLKGQAETAEENQIRPPLDEMVPIDPDESTAAIDRRETFPVLMRDDPPAAGLQTGPAGDDPLAGLPGWARQLPAVNAGLNTLATLLLVAGAIAIKRNHAHAHRSIMLAAVVVSAAFLGCYLTYHWALGQYTDSHGRPFLGTGAIRTVYYAILISHVLLAIAVPVLVVIALSRAYRQRWEAHKRITRWTWPIWMYVSVTGVVIYGMLYHWPVDGAAAILP